MARPLAVITGASSGIGAQFARRLCAQYDLLLVARREARLQLLAAELHAQSGSMVQVLAADLTDERALGALAARVAAEPRLSLLINNAGFGARGTFWESELELQEQMHRLHIAATLRLSHAALRNLVANDAGAIINVASVAGFLARAGSVSYGATKCWMIAFSEGLYLDLKRAGSSVKIQALCPGFTYSEFHDTMRVERSKMAPASFWLPAQFVVQQSLRGLAAGKLYVVPSWRYRAIVNLLCLLPRPLRLAVGAAASGRP
jgi:short-subunit dehydrogenase